MQIHLEPGAYRAVLLTTGVGVFLLAACAVRQPPPPGPDTVFIVDDSPRPPVEARTRVPVELDPLAVGLESAPQRTYVPWESPEGQSPAVLRVERTPPTAGSGEDQAAWRVTRTLVAPDGTETPHSQDDFALTADGSVVITQSIDFPESAVVVFDPPMVVIPAGLVPGETYTQQIFMSVYRVEDQSKPRTTGEASQAVTYIADERIRTPAPGPEADGAWGARHLRSVFSVQLGPAQVNTVTDQWFVDGVGLVSEQRHERTTALGMPFRNNVDRWALLSAGEEDGLGAAGGGPGADRVRTPGTRARALPLPGAPAGAASPPSSRSDAGTPPDANEHRSVRPAPAR